MEHRMNLQQVKTARANAVLTWFVNPDDPDNAFATINAAYAAAVAFLPTGDSASRTEITSPLDRSPGHMAPMGLRS